MAFGFGKALDVLRSGDSVTRLAWRPEVFGEPARLMLVERNYVVATEGSEDRGTVFRDVAGIIGGHLDDAKRCVFTHDYSGVMPSADWGRRACESEDRGTVFLEHLVIVKPGLDEDWVQPWTATSDSLLAEDWDYVR